MQHHPPTPRRPATSAAVPAELHLTDAEFARVCRVLKDQFGIAVDDTKRPLVESKIAKLVRTGGHPSFEAYEKAEMTGHRPAGLSSFIDQLTTNHTFFWREPAHFEFFSRHALPDLERRLQAQRDIRVWCAVSSSGEEAWTLGMLLMQHFGPRYSQWKAGVLASDISSKALSVAVAGVYDERAVSRLPAPLVSRYFKKIGGGQVEIVPELRRELVFRRLNLMTRPLPFRQPMHAVFCRNVMIYFNAQTNRELAQTLHETIAPGGYLFVGHSEPLERSSCPFEVVGPSIYRRRL